MNLIMFQSLIGLGKVESTPNPIELHSLTHRSNEDGYQNENAELSDLYF